MLLEPIVYRSLVEPPPLPDLLAGKATSLGEFIERGLGDLQILRQLVNGHDFIWYRSYYVLLRFGRPTVRDIGSYYRELADFVKGEIDQSRKLAKAGCPACALILHLFMIWNQVPSRA